MGPYLTSQGYQPGDWQAPPPSPPCGEWKPVTIDKYGALVGQSYHVSNTAIVQEFNMLLDTLDDVFLYLIERRGYGHRDTHELWTVSGRPLPDLSNHPRASGVRQRHRDCSPATRTRRNATGA